MRLTAPESAVRPHAQMRGQHARQRILFLADHLGPDDGGRSGVHGVTTYLLDVLPQLKACGYEIGACFLRHANPAAERLRAAGIEVSFLETQRFDPFVVRQIDELVQQRRYGILHCTQFRASLAARALARRRPGLKVALHMHDLNMPPKSVRWLHGLLARADDLAVCVSSAAGDVAVRGYYVQPDRVRVVHTGIATDAFEPLGAAERAEIRRELEIPPKAPILCLVGRFGRVKGHRTMLEIFRLVVRSRPDAVLLLIGDGPERPACERMAAELELAGRVRFLGYRSDVARWLAAADVAVVPSRSEGLCRAAIEANLCGIPAVAFDVGGVREALPDAVCGELVPAGNQAAFAAAIERALDGAVVPLGDLRVRLARERFGVAGHLRSLLACYDELQR